MRPRVLASATVADAGYDVAIVARAPGPLRTESGLTVVADDLGSVREIDTLVVPGGSGVHAATADHDLIDTLAVLASRSRRVVGVCSGAFLLAAMGQLDGRRATTHWARADHLARQHPTIDVDTDAIWVRDGNVWTSAGVTAGIDVALALVEDDVGVEVAETVARWLVMFLRRPGGQSQFAGPVWRRARLEPVRRAQDLIDTEPGGDHRVGVLAARVAMSERHFLRRFTAETGCTPARYVAQARVEAARHELETTDDTLPPSPRGSVSAPRSRCAGRSSNISRPHPTTTAGASAGASRTGVIPHDHAIDHHRHPVVPGLHGARRHRAVRGAQPHPRARGRVRRARARRGPFGQRDPRYRDRDHVRGGSVARGRRVPRRPRHPGLVDDERVLDWLRKAHETTTYTTSVCTGSLLLAAAGLLEGLTATTHWVARDLLPKYGAIVSEDRVVEHLDQRIITAAGVSSGIDMALRLVELLADRTAAEAVQLMIEYDPQPPFDAGALHKAGDHVLTRAGEYSAAPALMHPSV